MRQFSLYILAFVLVVLAASACKKDSDVFIPRVTETIIPPRDTDWVSIDNISNLAPPLNIEKLIARIQTLPHIDTFTAEIGRTIKTPDNVTVEIPANCCLGSNNQVCRGKLTVEILVLRKKGEFIAHNLPTQAGNKQLVSGGVVSVKVKQNGVEVRLANNKTYKVRYAMPSVDPQMTLWDGKLSGRFQFDWIPINSNIGSSTRPSVEPWQERDSGRITQGYSMLLDRFSLINCDKFGGDSTEFNNKFNVALPDSFTNTNTSIFVVFKDFNSVLPLYGIVANKYFTTLGRGLPVGRKVSIITLSLIKDRYYVAVSQEIEMARPINGQPNQSLRLIPQAITIEELKQRLQSL